MVTLASRNTLNTTHKKQDINIVKLNISNVHKSRRSEDYVPWKHQKVIYWVTHQSITVDTLHINFAFGAKII